MFLRIPAGQMADKVSREWNGPIVIAIGAAKRTKELFPFRGAMKFVGVVERVARLMPEIHHDLACVLEVIHLLLEMSQFCVRKVERNANYRLPGWTAPLIGQIAKRAELHQPFLFEFTIQLLHQAL